MASSEKEAEAAIASDGDPKMAEDDTAASASDPPSPKTASAAEDHSAVLAASTERDLAAMEKAKAEVQAEIAAELARAEAAAAESKAADAEKDEYGNTLPESKPAPEGAPTTSAELLSLLDDFITKRSGESPRKRNRVDASAPLYGPSRSLHVSGLAAQCTKVELEDLFSQYCVVQDATVRPGSFGFVHATTIEGAANAMFSLQGSTALHEAPLKIAFAKERGGENRPQKEKEPQSQSQSQQEATPSLRLTGFASSTDSAAVSQAFKEQGCAVESVSAVKVSQRSGEVHCFVNLATAEDGKRGKEQLEGKAIFGATSLTIRYARPLKEGSKGGPKEGGSGKEKGEAEPPAAADAAADATMETEASADTTAKAEEVGMAAASTAAKEKDSEPAGAEKRPREEDGTDGEGEEGEGRSRRGSRGGQQEEEEG